MKALLLLCLWVLTLTRGPAAELMVYAAASLTDVMKELASIYERQSGDKLAFNFNASSMLVRQIQEGAPADLFFSADEAKMDTLEKAGLLASGSREDLLSNTLVIVVPADSDLRITAATDLTKPEVKKIAVAEPSSVPVGVYTKAYLTQLGLWDKVLPKIVPTENVRASLAAVESGNVEAGTVYHTDALMSKKVKIAYEVPQKDGPKITYPVAILKESRNPDAAKKLLAFFGSSEARTLFEKYGFSVIK
jgi:molybdate transport system substrate-binding protein